MTQFCFVAVGGEPLSQLAFHEVQAQGTTIAQMQPFLANFPLINIDALALVSAATIPDEALAGLPATNIRYPALYAPTGEPILLRGTLPQLGQEQVELARQAGHR